MVEAKSRKGHLWFIVLLLGLAAAGGWWKSQQGKLLVIKTASVSEGVLEQQLLATGHVVNARRMKVTALLPGRVIAVSAKAGDRVKQHQILVKQDPQSVEIDLQEATLKLQLAQLALDDTGRTHQLKSRMRRNKIISDDALQLSKFAHKRAQLELQLAQNNLQRAQLRLDNSNISAPFDAWVVERKADVGQWVDEGATLFELAAADENRIEVSLDASDFAAIELGMSVQLRSDAYPDTHWNETVAWRSAAVQDKDDNSFVLHLSLGKDAPPLLLGQRVEANIVLAEKNGVLQLPIQHLRHRNGHSGVWLLQQQSLLWREVSTGLQNDHVVEISSGLAREDKVLAAGEIVPDTGLRLTTAP